MKAVFVVYKYLTKESLSKLIKLDVSKSCGLDKMHPYLFRDFSHEIIPALINLLNLSLETHTGQSIGVVLLSLSYLRKAVRN